MYIRTRKEKTDDLLDQFSSGAILTTSLLTMDLYPSEVRRVKRIYPNLSFEVTTTYLYYNNKKCVVRVTRK